MSIRRFAERFERGERHQCIEDAVRLTHIQTGAPDPAWDRALPLCIGLRTLVVETSDGYTPSLEAIVDFIRQG